MDLFLGHPGQNRKQHIEAPNWRSKPRFFLLVSLEGELRNWDPGRVDIFSLSLLVDDS